jgi:hypothetical protein
MIGTITVALTSVPKTSFIKAEIDVAFVQFSLCQAGLATARTGDCDHETQNNNLL